MVAPADCTEVNGNSKSTNERSPSLKILIHYACRAIISVFWSALASQVGPLQNIFFLAVGYLLFQILCPHRPASRAGSRAVSPVC
jgi:hypothetical protein